MKWYRINTWINPEIEEYEIIRCTKLSVFFVSKTNKQKIYRQLKTSCNVKWFNNKDKAIEYFKDSLAKNIKYYKLEIKKLKNMLNNIEVKIG